MPRRAQCIAFANHKGGTGKTTSCLSIAGYLAKSGSRVLVVDLDPQANATSGLGIDVMSLQHSTYDVVLHQCDGYRGMPITRVILETDVGNLYIAPSELDLAVAEILMQHTKDRTGILKRILEEVRPLYNYILVDFENMEREGNLQVVCEYPEGISLQDNLITMKARIDEFKPGRVAVDSLSALERVSTVKGFREFVISLTSFMKQRETSGLFTSTTATLMGGTSITETHISTVTDSIVLLRYVEMFGEIHRGLTVLKMRGSIHDKDIREFTIDGQGMHIGNRFRDVTGILSGTPQYIASAEMERIGAMFGEGGRIAK